MISPELVTLLIGGFITLGLLRSSKKDVVENFINVPLVLEPQRESMVSAVPSNYQQSLPPRFINAGMNAHIRRDRAQGNYIEPYVSPQQQNYIPIRSSQDEEESVVPDRQAVYDRLVYSTARSRRYGEGDPIRGDLPIVPTLPVADPNSPIWFVPSASITRDLRMGALQVLAGDNETSNELIKLKAMANPASRSITLRGPHYGDVDVSHY